MIRDYNSGDVDQLWLPNLGVWYPTHDTGKPLDNTFKPYGALPNGGVGNHVQDDFIKQYHNQPVFMLVPFDGSNLGSISGDATPFIYLSFRINLLGWFAPY